MLSLFWSILLSPSSSSHLPLLLTSYLFSNWISVWYHIILGENQNFFPKLLVWETGNLVVFLDKVLVRNCFYNWSAFNW